MSLWGRRLRWWRGGCWDEDEDEDGRVMSDGCCCCCFGKVGKEGKREGERGRIMLRSKVRFVLLVNGVSLGKAIFLYLHLYSTFYKRKRGKSCHT